MKAKYGWMMVMIAVALLLSPDLMAQCSICTKTASDLGESAAKGFNAGILYLAAVPFTVCGVIGYQWYKGTRSTEEDE